MKSLAHQSAQVLAALFFAAATGIALSNNSSAQTLATEFLDELAVSHSCWSEHCLPPQCDSEAICKNTLPRKFQDRISEGVGFLHSPAIIKKNTRLLPRFSFEVSQTEPVANTLAAPINSKTHSQVNSSLLVTLNSKNSVLFFPKNQLLTNNYWYHKKNTVNNRIDFSEVMPAAQTEETPDPAGEPPSLRLVTVQEYQAAPSISVAMPFAYGLSLGSAGIGLGWQSRTRFTNQADGGLGIGIGLGNPQKAVGFDVVASILDVSDFARRGSFSFKIHRTLPDDFAVAIGVQNAIIWGFTDAGTSAYGVVTKTFRLRESVEQPFSLVVISGGLGGGQFRSESDIYNDINSVGVFGSMAVRVVEPVNALVEWTGQDLTLGLSYVPFRNTPLVLTGALTDITGNAGDGSRFIFRLGYLLSF